MKDSYIMHCDYSSHFELLTDEELGRLIRDVNNYVKNGVLPQYSERDRVLNMAFSFMKTNIDIETEKYIKKCEKNKENGRRGGRPRNPEKANGFDENPEEAKKPILILILQLILILKQLIKVCVKKARTRKKSLVI